MEKIKFVVQVAAVVCINILVRFNRACDSALWEICPEMYKWTQRAIEGAHRTVCEEQRRALGKTKTPKVKLKPAVEPVTEIPSQFRDHDEALAVCWRLRQEWNAAREARKAFKYGTPEYKAANDVAEFRWDVLQRAYRTPVAS